MVDLSSELKAFSHLDYLDRLAIDAGDAIMEVYQKDIGVQYKLDHSPLTEADLSANRVILKGLKKT